MGMRLFSFRKQLGVKDGQKPLEGTANKCSISKGTIYSTPVWIITEPRGEGRFLYSIQPRTFTSDQHPREMMPSVANSRVRERVIQ